MTELRKARKEAGLTQMQASAASGVPQSTLSGAELGTQRVTIAQLEALLRAYGRTDVADAVAPYVTR